ncbi:methylase involved in ubiquinone/menaquinone biosynthesis [Anopheles sinensis]|uniref:Methylase involved in ubiquinone/menaquinone biosynthesis n=1 Tax=Anopheles sinensis TaxID=74873 RepID=A0A084VEY8_ANOSI|nr:methylase involved in ubiquinone/menaquinone biosynthesis [Anopheles sinensis]
MLHHFGSRLPGRMGQFGAAHQSWGGPWPPSHRHPVAASGWLLDVTVERPAGCNANAQCESFHSIENNYSQIIFGGNVVREAAEWRRVA